MRSKHIKAKQVKPGDVSPKLRDGCPDGTRLLGDVCVRTPTTSGTYFQARLFCTNDGLRVPSLGEAGVLARNHDVPGVSSVQFFWTEENTGPTASGMEDDSDAVAADPGGNSSGRVLCVTIPRQGG